MRSHASVIDARLVSSIVETDDPVCVSIFIPVNKGETAQSSIYLANSLAAVEATARGRELDFQPLEGKMAALQKMGEDSMFWTYQSRTLACYISHSVFRILKLPVAARFDLDIAPHFKVLPLLEVLQGQALFYVLSVSRNESHLYIGSETELSEVSVEGLPSMQDVEAYTEVQGQTQFHTRTPARGPKEPGGPRRGAMFFGHGANADTVEFKDPVLEYFRKLDTAVRSITGASKWPLVLAGPEDLHAMFRSISKYPNLAERGVTGNFEDSPEELHRRALPIVEPLFMSRMEEDMARFRETGRRELVGHLLEDILHSAAWGAVDTLFISKGARARGVFSSETGEIMYTDHADPQAEDLFNLAAIYCHRHGSTVHVLPEANMPAQNSIAALYRYPLPASTFQAMDERIDGRL